MSRVCRELALWQVMEGLIGKGGYWQSRSIVDIKGYVGMKHLNYETSKSNSSIT